MDVVGICFMVCKSFREIIHTVYGDDRVLDPMYIEVVCRLGDSITISSTCKMTVYLRVLEQLK